MAFAAIVAVALGCGGGGGAASEDETRVTIMYAGPAHDDGYHQAQFNIGKDIERELGSSFKATAAENVPYTEQATKVTEQLIAQGSDILIDTASYGDLFEEPCRANQEKVDCMIMLPHGELTPNMAGFYPEFWKQEYVLGAVAGLVTKSNTIGAVNPLSIPLTNGYMNSFFLGCQATNPKCKMRIVTTNSYYDPPSSTEAANTLANTGADVLTGWVNDSSPCQVAQQRGLLAVGHYYDYKASCPDAIIGTALWGDPEYNQWFVDQAKASSEGKFDGGETKIFEFGDGANLSPWTNIPPDAEEQGDQIAKELEAGELEPFVGPFVDTEGKKRMAGEKLSSDFIRNEWEWRLQGMIGG